MEIPPPFQQLPADPKFIDQIVNQIKSQGTFDQWRRECLADVDTKPAYQNLTFRVDNAVAGFLGKQKWRPDMVKNQVRENLRKHILELGIIDRGVDRIVEQVVQPKVLPLFHPAVEDAIYNYLGIKNPRAESNTQITETTNSSASPKKAFRPMPVSIPSRDKEDGTPPPGEEFDLEAITPSSESRCGSSLKKELGDDVSDVSMEDSRPMPETGLERICSPVSPQSIPPGEKPEDLEAPNNRVGSALSAISSGDDLPSASPRGESPNTPDEFQASKNQPPDRQQDSLASSDDDDNEEEDDEDDFSSPEFEKLEPNAPASRTVTPVPGEEEPEEKEEQVPTKADDHYKWRPKLDCRDPDRKPDEDPGDLSSKKTGDPTHQASRNQLSGNSSHASRDVGLADTGKSSKSTRSDSVVEPAEAKEVETDNTPKEVTERSISSSSKDASRSKSDSHKSDRREKSHKDKSRSKDRDRDRDRDRERRREREKREEAERRSKSHHSKSSHRDRDERRKSSSHRDKDRDRHKDRDRNRSKSDADRHRSSSSSKDKDRKSSGLAVDKFRKEVSSSPLPTVHPKAYLWKRPAEKPTALWDYLARFPDHVFDESVDVSGGLSDVSVSSVSSYEDSDAESTVLVVLSEVEIDSDMEQAIVHSGGRVVYPNPPETDTVENDDKGHDDSSDDDDDDAAIESDYTPASDEFARAESCLRDQQLNINNNKRVRKLNTRYSDSYVGSELRKIIKTKHSTDSTQRSPRLGGSKLLPARENQENCMQGSLSEDVQEREEVSDYAPPDAKRLKTDQPLPSSPESVQSDLTPQLPHVATNTPPPADVQSTVEDEPTKDNISPNGRRRSLALKQPQQRYDDTDLYKPRPVITPSSRRSRRHDES